MSQLRDLLFRIQASGNCNVMLQEKLDNFLGYAQDRDEEYDMLRECAESGNLNFVLQEEVDQFLNENDEVLDDEYE